MEIPTISPMLAFYGSEAASYQPTRPGMQFNLEDGNPQASLENLKRLKLTVKCFWVRKQATRVLIQFLNGEQYVALGLSDPRTLARVAADAGFGAFDDLRNHYDELLPEYEGELPPLSVPHEPFPR